MRNLGDAQVLVFLLAMLAIGVVGYWLGAQRAQAGNVSAETSKKQGAFLLQTVRFAVDAIEAQSKGDSGRVQNLWLLQLADASYLLQAGLAANSFGIAKDSPVCKSRATLESIASGDLRTNSGDKSTAAEKTYVRESIVSLVQALNVRC